MVIDKRTWILPSNTNPQDAVKASKVAELYKREEAARALKITYQSLEGKSQMTPSTPEHNDSQKFGDTDTIIEALSDIAGDLQKYDKFPRENLTLYALTILEASVRLKELEELRLNGG